MDDRTPQEKTSGQAGVLGTALAAVLAFALASGSWQWFSTYIGLTLLAVVLTFSRPPRRTPGPLSGYARGLTAYALVVGLSAALALAPAMQRWRWLFPMPGTREGCAELGRYQAMSAQAAVGGLAARDSAAVAYAQADQARHAVDTCLAATTTQWLPVYALGVALLVALGSSWPWARGGRTRGGSGPGRGAT